MSHEMAIMIAILMIAKVVSLITAGFFLTKGLWLLISGIAGKLSARRRELIQIGQDRQNELDLLSGKIPHDYSATVKRVVGWFNENPGADGFSVVKSVRSEVARIREDGFLAAQYGRPASDCPYDAGSPESEQWLRYWKADGGR